MRNLLAEAFKLSLRREYLLRLVTVACFTISVVMVLAILSLIPAYFLSQWHYSALENEHRLLQASITSLTDEAARTPVAVLTKKLEVLSGIKTTQRLTEVILAVLATRDADIAIRSFAYGRKLEKAELKIRGVANSRDSLLSFKKRLEQDTRFFDVELPISNLARESDIEFEVTLTGNF